MNPNSLLQFFDAHRERGEPLVLVTVIETSGSTYSKTGTQMLIDGNGVFRGMLSGGCLESDLAVRAQVVLESAASQVVTYDLARDDELWGLGVGCDGMMRVQLQPLLADDDYAPFGAIAEVLRGDSPEEVAISIVGEAPGELLIGVAPPPNILILGAGLDAPPLVRIAAELGWRCTVVDHRPAYLERGDFGAAQVAHCMPADDLSATLDLAGFCMAIVMSHHLASDRSYLRQLAETAMPYIGLLGPANRRARLLDELGAARAAIEHRLRGPAGMDLGGTGPEAIALSIAAEMQQVLASR